MMNELIWDIFKQSGIDIGEDQESNIEKFAELIVKECARVYRDEYNNFCESDTPLYPSRLNQILDTHFGVK
jgi:hypothetical protein